MNFKLAGVMGWPVAQSRSPALHTHWLRRYGIEGAYLRLPVAPEALETALRALPLLGYAGCNLTVPHKEAALVFLDRIEPAARVLGAVNTVVVAPDGSLEGFSSDGHGFLEHLDAEQPGWRNDRRPVLVLGAGGSARSILAALLAAGRPEIRLANRGAERALLLAERFGPAIQPVAWASRSGALAGCGLVVNTTTQGMRGAPALDLALDDLDPDAIVADIVYTPLETPLLAAARARGNPVVDGLGMLMHQARPGFAAWFGVDPAVDPALRSAVLEAPLPD